ncbi:hypothetical protein Q2298_13325 [Rhodococcus electrodiphilus]|uniref:hypothetical protein n=1 Tax=Rhodococcus ruber TaxID=1830 RepID=UPI0026F47084|nr:hypothetical protein [Rhodococcus ruber]MDO2379333.1 hypothetical protein [Rhodococcus ruber]
MYIMPPEPSGGSTGDPSGRGLREVLEGRLPDLAACARLLSVGSERAAPILDRALARAVATWRGPIGPELCAYAVSWFVYLLHAEGRAPRRVEGCGDDAVLFSTLPPIEQIALVLGEFEELPPAGIAAVAGRALAEFELEASRPASVREGLLHARH